MIKYKYKLSEPNLNGTNFCVQKKNDVQFIQVKVTKISYLGT